MKIALCGPSELSLTAFDEMEINSFFDVVSEGDEIVILAHNSIELQAFKFFTEKENLKFASKLTVYTYPTLEQLPTRVRKPLEFLISIGAKHHSFQYGGIEIKREYYAQSWEHIFKTENVDLYIAFHDLTEATNRKVMIPADVAKKLQKEARVYYLPGESEEKFKLTPTEKTRIIS